MPAAGGRSAGNLRAALAEIRALDPPLLAARLTLATLLLAPIGAWLVRPAVAVLAVAGLVVPALARSRALWLALAALAALRVAADWPMSDNHGYLLAVWCLALGLGSGAGEPGRAALARNARLLIGIAFALATLQKVLVSPDFTDGTFFRWALAVDPRFEELGRLLGRDDAALERTRALLEAPPGEPVPPGAEFVETPALYAAALALTGATLALEGAVALAFLVPPRWRVARARDALLALFCATTYLVAPVAGFGWLLLAMGSAQAQGRRSRALLLAAFALVVFYEEVPWLALLAGPPAG
jgi:hypothetical protein